MKGAREYSGLFKGNEQFGKLYIQKGNHARGATLHVWVLPTFEILEGSIHSCKEAVEVYGVTGGNPGWTETYGWLHRGKWEGDFEKIVRFKKLELEAKRKHEIDITKEIEKNKRQRIRKLLDAY